MCVCSWAWGWMHLDFNWNLITLFRLNWFQQNINRIMIDRRSSCTHTTLAVHLTHVLLFVCVYTVWAFSLWAVCIQNWNISTDPIAFTTFDGAYFFIRTYVDLDQMHLLSISFIISTKFLSHRKTKSIRIWKRNWNEFAIGKYSILQQSVIWNQYHKN